MQTNDLQQMVVEACKKLHAVRHVSLTEEQIVMHLVEEVGELATQYVHKVERPEKYSLDAHRNALVDIFAHTLLLVDAHHLSLEDIVLETLEKERNRYEVNR